MKRIWRELKTQDWKIVEKNACSSTRLNKEDMMIIITYLIIFVFYTQIKNQFQLMQNR